VIFDTLEGVSCFHIEKGLVWNQACTQSMVLQDGWVLDDLGLHQDLLGSQPLLQVF
jgi:hypothetical protein